MDTHTLRSAVWQKFVSFVEEHSLRDMLVIIGLFFLAGILSAAVIDTVTMARAIESVMEWHHNALPTVLLMTFGVFSAPSLYRNSRRALSDLCAMSQDSVPPVDTIDGIPTGELLDHLFTEKTFRCDDIVAKWGIARPRYSALNGKLKSLGVLTHGASNTTILAEGMTRERVAGLLTGAETAEEVSTVRIVRVPSPTTASFQTRALSASC